MISFNENDINMPLIKRGTGFEGVITRADYRIYGLKPEHSYHILIETHTNGAAFEQTYKKTYVENQTKNRQLGEFLVNLKLTPKFIMLDDPLKEPCQSQRDLFYIGLRRDVREFPEFSARLIQTLVYFYDRQLQLRNIKISHLPKFKL